MAADRSVLVHYHIFKNAGSSVDFALVRSFGSGWASFEGRHVEDVQTCKQLRQFLEDRPEIRAVSSHLARPPLPFPGCKPIVFLRHPLLRARSVYEFTRRNPEQQQYPLDRSGTFAEYVRWALQTGRTDGGANVRNYQVIHLSDASWRTPILKAEARIEDLEQAKAVIESWGIVGIVEDYKMSTRRFQAAYASHFPTFNFVDVRANRTSSEIPDIQSHTAAMREELGPALFDRLSEANQLDLELYNWALRKFSRLENSLASDGNTRSLGKSAPKSDGLEGPGTSANQLTIERLRDELRYLAADWEALVAYKADLTAQLDALVRVRSQEMAEHEALARAHEDLIARHDMLVRLRDTEIAEHEALARAHGDLMARHEMLVRVRDEEIAQHEALARAHNDLLVQFETLTRIRNREIEDHETLARAYRDLVAQLEVLPRR